MRTSETSWKWLLAAGCLLATPACDRRQPSGSAGASNTTGVSATNAAFDPATAYDGKPVVYDNSYVKGPPPATPVPAWAFAMDPPESAEFKKMPDDDVPRSVPGSNLHFTRTQVLKHTDVVDWHPGNHPPAPPIVMNGRKPQPAACAYCHLPNGRGQPENAPLAGLPANYFIRQIASFTNGTRKTADMRMASWHGMAEIIAPRIHRDEIAAAARYYASLPLAPYVKVIETATVPRTRSVGYTLVAVPGGGTEPIGNRIIETPSDERRFRLNDSEATVLAYVPVGSIARGKLIATSGGGRTTACTTCHGGAFEGTAEIPPLAGRSPSNLVRQIYNFRTRARSDEQAHVMYPVVDRLDDKDIVAVVAYLSHLLPGARR